MGNESEFEQDRNLEAGNMPLNEGNESTSSEKYKEYGKKSLAPLIDLVHRYKGDVNPYVESIGRALSAASDSLAANQTEADKTVAGWFNEARNWFDGVKGKLESKNPSDLLNFLETEAKSKPGVMFATSYMVGLVFGRLGRHAVRMKSKSGTSEASDNASDISMNDDSQFSSDQIH